MIRQEAMSGVGGASAVVQPVSVATSRIADYTRLLFMGGLPLMIGVLVMQSARRQPIGSVLEMIVWHLLATVGLWLLRGRGRIEALVAVAGFVGVEVFALRAFGPVSGVGALVCLLLIVAVTHLGRRAALAMLLLASAVPIAVGFCVTGLHWWPVPQVQLGLPSTWIRSAVIMFFLSTLVLFTVDRFVRATRKAFADAEAAHHQESEARRLQAETARALGRARELETVGRLAGGVAHDFNNALTVILSCAVELQGLHPEGLGCELASDIERAARGAAATTRQLLTFTRKRDDASERSNPADSLRSSLRNLKRLIPADITLDAALEPCPDVPLGEGALVQMVVNLVLNARDACRSGDRVVVRTCPAGGEVMLAVEDTGSGLDAATKARIFEPFFTTKEDAGTGLGLAMVDATVSGRGGRVEVDSSEGRGTVVRVFLPALGSETTAPGTERMRADWRRSTVLVVEDEVDIQSTVRRTFEQAGARVATARSASEALAIIDARADLTFLCTDGVLVGGTALPVIQAFRARFPSAPILLCSGHEPVELEARGLLTGQHARLAKPFTPSELIAAANSLARGTRPACDPPGKTLK